MSRDKNWKIDQQSLLTFLKQKRSRQRPVLSEQQKNLLEDLLDFALPSLLQRKFEIVIAFIYRYFPDDLRYLVSSFFKKYKSANINLDLPPSKLIKEFAKTFKNLKYEGSQSVVLLTHDVDYRLCYDSVLWLAELEAEKGLKAAYYFLTNADYKISGSLLKQLLSLGHEVGVHGNYYDLRLAYKSPREIFRELQFAKKKIEDLLGQKVYGFRNHSLLASFPLLQTLEKLKFEYNSGLYYGKNQNNSNIYFCWPFRYLGKNLVEIPVSWPQDTEIFRNLNLSERAAFEYYKKRILYIRKLHGVACLNQHPSIVIRHKNFYRQLIKFVVDLPVLNKTPHDFVQRYNVKW